MQQRPDQRDRWEAELERILDEIDNSANPDPQLYAQRDALSRNVNIFDDAVEALIQEYGS